MTKGGFGRPFLFGVFFAPMTRFLAAVAVLFASSAALAQETGVYVGAAIGQASYREACRDFDTLIGISGAFSCSSEQATAGKVFAGWRFHRFLAAELSYIDYGEAKASTTVAGAVVNATTAVKAAGISALGMLPLGESLWVYGRLGLLQTHTTSKAQGAVVASSDHGETELHTGVGAMFQISRGWALRAEYERVNDSRIDLSSVGVQYRF